MTTDVYHHDPDAVQSLQTWVTEGG